MVKMSLTSSSRGLLGRRLPVMNRSFSTALPPQINSSAHLSRVSKEAFSKRMESDLIKIYDAIPKAKRELSIPSGPIEYYMRRYSATAGGTMLVHAILLFLGAAYLDARNFNEEHSKYGAERVA